MISALWCLTVNWSQQSLPIIKKGGSIFESLADYYFNALSNWWGNMLAMLETWCLTIPTSMLGKHRERLTWLLYCRTTEIKGNAWHSVTVNCSDLKKKKTYLNVDRIHLCLSEESEEEIRVRNVLLQMSQTEVKTLLTDTTTLNILTPNTYLKQLKIENHSIITGESHWNIW